MRLLGMSALAVCAVFAASVIQIVYGIDIFNVDLVVSDATQRTRYLMQYLILPTIVCVAALTCFVLAVRSSANEIVARIAGITAIVCFAGSVYWAATERSFSVLIPCFVLLTVAWLTFRVRRG